MGRRTIRTFREVLAAAAMEKRDSAVARRSGGVQGAEKPRDVYLSACEQIASAFSQDGFRYQRSKQEFSRVVGPFKHRIGFQASRDNIRGPHVVLWIHADVRCSRLVRWRREQSHPLSGRSDYLCGGMVHLIENKHAWVEWELADPKQRQATVEDAVTFLRSVVLPYFHGFEDPVAVLSEIEQGRSFNAFTMENQIDLALCFGRRDLAQRVLDIHVAAGGPDLQRSIRRALDKIKREGMDDFFRGTFNGEEPAWAHLAYGLVLDGIEPDRF